MSRTERTEHMLLILLTVFAVAWPTLALPQQSLNPYSSKTPSELVRQFDSAPRLNKQLIVDALLEKRTESLPVLRATLDSGIIPEIVFACGLLTEMRDTIAAGSLIALVSHQDLQVSLTAINGLRDLGVSRASPELVRALSVEGLHADRKRCCLVALGRLGSSDAASVIRRFLADPDTSVQIAAAKSLAMLNSYDGRLVLLANVENPNPAFSRSAIQSLGYLRDSGSAAILQNLLSDPKGKWKTEARIAIERRRLASVRTASGRVLLLKALSADSNHRVSQWAIEELADIVHPDAANALTELSRHDSSAGQEASRLLRLRGNGPR